MPEFIPVSEPLLDGNERAYVLDCVDSGWVSSEGPYVARFEQELAAYVGRAHGVAVTSGSTALDLAVEALDIGPGDEVIMPTFTIISCALSVVRRGGVPVVVDAEPDTWTMDVRAIEALITPRTRAIMVVHTYGLPVDMAPVLEVAKRHDLAIIEDAAEAHGLTYDGRRCGSFGDVSIFSFYPNKLVTTGEGGMVLTDSEAIAERCRSLRNLCFQPERRFVHEELGYNYRMSNLQAAPGVAQLENLDRHMELRRAMGHAYTELLRDCPGATLPLERTAHAENGYWVYGIVLGDAVPFDASEMAARLARLDIGTRPFFYPMHRQPVFMRAGLFAGVACPVAERLAARGLYLPSSTGLTTDRIERVADGVRSILESVA